MKDARLAPKALAGKSLRTKKTQNAASAFCHGAAEGCNDRYTLQTDERFVQVMANL